MVENFGSYLKHERELRGVPLEEIAGVTKIHIRYLQALENNNFEELPGEVFVKGYIRSYAKIIGSNVDEMLNAYDEALGKKTLDKADEAEPLPQDMPERETKPVLRWVLTAGIILGVLGGGGYLVSKINDNKEPDQAVAPLQVQKQPSQDLAMEAVPEVDPSVTDPGHELAEVAIEPDSAVDDTISGEVVETADQKTGEAEIEGPEPQSAMDPQSETGEQEPETAVQPVLTPESSDQDSPPEPELGTYPLKLSIQVTENSWFNMTVDDFREEDFILPAGTGKTFYGNERFRLTIGNREGTQVTLNGKPLVLPESSDKVVRNFIINSQLLEE